MTRHFFMSAFWLATLVAYFLLWSWTATVLTGSEDFAFGKLSDMVMCLQGGGVLFFLVLIGSLWLLGCGFL